MKKDAIFNLYQHKGTEKILEAASQKTKKKQKTKKIKVTNKKAGLYQQIRMTNIQERTKRGKM